MKRKVVIFALIFIILSSALSFSSLAYEYVIPKGEYLTDKGELIPNSEENAISDALAAAETGCGAMIRVYTYVGLYEDYGINDYITDSEENIENLVLLVIRYDYYDSEFYYYVCTAGDADSKITSGELDRILDDDGVYDKIKAGNLKDGIIAYASLTADAYLGTLRPNFIKVLIVSLVIALAVSVSISMWVYFSYRKKLHSESYPLGRYASMDLKIQRDSFVTKFVTCVRIKTSDRGRMGRGGGRPGGSGYRGGR